ADVAARLFHPIAAHATPDALTLEGEGFHHLVHVLRARAGDEVEVFDGRGRRFPGKLERVDDEHALVRLGPPEAASAATRAVFVVQGVPKGERMDYVVQKGTELGATAFLPFAAERSVVRLEGTRADTRRARWSRIAEEAARQCGRADVPPVHGIAPLAESLA